MSETRGPWSGVPVLVTGHTGFKGGWLTLMLQQRGALVHGYSLEPPTTPSLFEVADIASVLASHTHGDLADFPLLCETFRRSQPQVVFHLAAQALVREGYRNPLGTIASNVLGTANVLEAARHCASVKAVIVVTTDKVYENRETDAPYSESDPLGGHDPYSGSKAAAEIVTSSYRECFFGRQNGGARVATARAGNVIGGGDWATDRLVPDCLRAFQERRPVELRYPRAVRPWQHVLEPLSGYVLLAERLLEPGGHAFARAWNFGPDASGDATVGAVARLVARAWGDSAQVVLRPSADHPPEAGLLRLESARARAELGWSSHWSLEEAIAHTVAWHHAWREGADMRSFSHEQIRCHAEGIRV